VKEKYYIREFASMLNISNQTLRYYDKIGLLKPAETNSETNYRMYSLEQIWTLERIRHLQSLGLNLDEIKSAISCNDIENFVRILERKHRDVADEIARLNDVRACLEDSIHHYHYNKQMSFNEVPYRISCNERYLLTERYRPGEPLVGTAGPRLLIKKAKDEFGDTMFVRQIGFLLDYEKLRQGKLSPTHYFTLIKGRPEMEHPDILAIPAGDFICVRDNILMEGYQLKVVNQLFADDPRSRLALALECESDLDTSNKAFVESLFELQVSL
jgi:DNA-binding transcriptional MerR regulator